MRFGATVSRGKYLITHLLPKFYERYPKIQVQFFSHNTLNSNRWYTTASLTSQ